MLITSRKGEIKLNVRVTRLSVYMGVTLCLMFLPERQVGHVALYSLTEKLVFLGKITLHGCGSETPLTK